MITVGGDDERRRAAALGGNRDGERGRHARRCRGGGESTESRTNHEASLIEADYRAKCGIGDQIVSTTSAWDGGAGWGMSSAVEISTDPARLDIDLIHKYLATESYWAQGRSRETVERSIANSLCFGAYDAGRQIGFARVSTDRAVFAYLMDVFVLPAHRGRGIGKQLMAAALAHPDLQGLRLIALRTRDAHGLYARFGFTALPDPETMMSLQDPAARAAGVSLGARVNEYGQPIGWPVPDWTPARKPTREPIDGQRCRVVPIDERYAADLYAANSLDRDGRSWTYLPYGPFSSEAEYVAWMRRTCFGADPFFYAILDRATDRAVGVASHMRIQPEVGSIEVGHVHFSPALQRTAVATEAMYLMAQRAFALGHRRYEWKCDALNWPSRAAAQRFGFSFEGIFRQATVYKGRNRDTAWFAMTDGEWPSIARAFETWLAPENFTAAGDQRTSLSEVMRARDRGRVTATT
jgi:RimJ/RimL family protein N-acetyltransferase